MNCLSLLFCLTTYLLASTEAALDAEGIVGGDIANDDKYRYQISMRNQTGWHVCGGAIIGDQHVLTAAHCVTDERRNFNNDYRQIVAGALELNDTDSDVIKVDIEKVYIPSEYSLRSAIGDISVLKLKQPLNLVGNKRLVQVELPEEDESYADVNATITGFGYTTMKYNESYPNKENGGYDTYKKKFATAKVLSNTDCEKAWRQPIQAQRICAQMYQPTDGTSAGVCSGDSGGPLVYDDSIIIGILSTSSTGCDESRYPAVYTRVSAYLDFIKNAMADCTTCGINIHQYTNN